MPDTQPPAAGGPTSGTPAAPLASVPPPVREVAGDSGLFTRLTYLTAFRLVLVSALLVATAWVTLRPGEALGFPLSALLYGLIAFIYTASLGYLWVLRQRRRLRPLAYAQVAGDLLVATFLVYLTGGADSIFSLMYPLAIVNASILLERQGAVIAAAGSALSFALLTTALAHGELEPAAEYLAQRPLSHARLVFVVVANGTAFLLTAALSSYLTEQLRRTGERLSEREVDYAALSELHGSIVRSMSAGIVTTDVHGRVTFLNPAAEAILGLSLPRLVDEPLRLWFPALSACAEEALARKVGRGEVEERDAHGTVRLLGFVVQPLTRQSRRARTRRGSAPGLAIVVEDLTPLRAMQEAARRGDRLAAVGQLAAGLAHELRNPLASMSGAIELMSRAEGLNDSERRLMDIVLREAGRLNNLVTDFLAFARPTPVQLAPTDLGALADETLGVFRHSPIASQLELVRAGPDSVRIFADSSQLRQVLWNLLQNAAEAMGGQGRIEVAVGWTADGLARLSVHDSGPGLAPEQMARLFEPFFTTKPQGTGLGLASVHRIVEAHRGRIEVESSPGRGALFQVLLPVGEAPEALGEEHERRPDSRPVGGSRA